MKIYNIAVIAHVDHGKTTLIDGMLKQALTFRENEAEMSMECIMDSNAQERERGITILAKNTSVHYENCKINIIDTPGHKDFSGEVERVIGMADGALLIIDSAEGPLAQTKFVLKEAFKKGLKIIVVINKVDRKDARPQEVFAEIENLFLQLAKNHEQLDFPVIYAVGREGKADTELPIKSPNLKPLFDKIISYLPEATSQTQGPFHMVIANIDYDNHIGKLAIGRIKGGGLAVGSWIKKIDSNGAEINKKIEKIYIFNGLKREEVNAAPAGE
ncbi:MAG: GTP-binding protein, partial [Patescibacteria group bacterium]